MSKLNWFLTVVLIGSIAWTCSKDHLEAIPDSSIVSKNIQAAGMPGDTVYIPVYSGAKMKVVKNTVKYWTVGGVQYSFAKFQAGNIVKPFNYQQDSLKERVVISDTTKIYFPDSVFICRMKIL
jgi:hypothetical protein